MASSIRLSPFAIFCFVCVIFVILYGGKYLLLPSNDFLDDYSYTEKKLLRKNETITIPQKVSMKALLEISIYLAEQGGAILKTVREKNDLNVSYIYFTRIKKYGMGYSQ